MVKLTIQIDKRNFEESLRKSLEEKLDTALNDIADFIGSESDRILRDPEEGSFDTGFLANSLVIDKEEKLHKEVGFGALYACVVGGRQSVKTDIGKIEINRIKNHNVFTKDGKYHKVLNNISIYRVITKPNLVLLNYEKTRQKNGLLVTDDHLVLTFKNNYVYWEHAKNLQMGDFVIKPRKIAHNKDIKTGIYHFCINCGMKFYVEPSTIKYRKANYCSQSCYHKFTLLNGTHPTNKGSKWKLTIEQRLNKSGKNNPSYKDGASCNHSRLLLYGYEWTDELREFIKERDNYICQECGLHEDFYDYSFHVHHIDANKFNNNPENLITLCPSCHGKKQWQDCELVSINWRIFEPVKLIKVEKINAFNYFTGKGALKKVKLYDLQIDDENSFVCGGIIIHNSFIEFGTSPHFPPLDVIYSWLWRKRNDLGLKVDNKKTTKLNGKTYISGILNISWAIAKKMSEKGTEEHPFLRPSYNLGKSKSGEFLKKAMKK